jgi:hypothetical protein
MLVSLLMYCCFCVFHKFGRFHLVSVYCQKILIWFNRFFWSMVNLKTMTYLSIEKAKNNENLLKEKNNNKVRYIQIVQFSLEF